MSVSLLILSVLAPLILAAVWPARGLRCAVGILAPLAPLPALVLAVMPVPATVELPWLLLGARWGLDPTGRVFLALTAGLWLTAGFYARGYLAGDPRRNRFMFFWLLTLGGNLGLPVAQDLVSFFLFFTLMSFAAYGLIVHDGRTESLRAGRVYITLVVLGEILLFWAAVIASGASNSLLLTEMTAALAGAPSLGVVAGLVLTGFGIKLGIMPLHGWLPLAHPAAPTPASAVLSGAMIKAGLLGWLRFLPVGEVTLPFWGSTCLALGATSTVLAAVLGIAQHNAKTVLAYSSISQVGLAALAFGTALLVPEAWPLAQVALWLFVVHHGVSKAALFLGLGLARAGPGSPGTRALVCGGLVLAAGALVGLPLTSGFETKQALKTVAATAPGTWSPALSWLLPLGSVATALLLCRFLYLAWPPAARGAEHPPLAPAMMIPWLVLCGAIVMLALP